MRASIRYLMFLATAMMIPSLALANRAPPEQLPERTPQVKAEGSPLVVVLQDGGAPLRLEIPRGLLPKEAGGKRALPFGMNEFATFASGLFLSLAIAVGGIWLVRKLGGASQRRFPNSATAATVAMVLIASVSAAVAWANAPASPPRPPAEPAGLTVQISIVERGEAVLLHASAADLARLTTAVRPAAQTREAAPVAQPNAPAK